MTAHHTPPPIVHHSQLPPSKLVRRTATAAIRTAHPGSPPTAATWQPWAPLQKEADARLKTEIDTALAELDAQQGEAARLLDTAYTLADSRSAKIQAAAWEKFGRDMEAADHLWDGIVTPALAAYSDRLQRAHERFAQALDSAESTHSQMLSDAARARNDGGTVTGVA